MDTVSEVTEDTHQGDEYMPDLVDFDEPDEDVEWGDVQIIGVEFTWSFETPAPLANQPLIYAFMPETQEAQHTSAAASAA